MKKAPRWLWGGCNLESLDCEQPFGWRCLFSSLLFFSWELNKVKGGTQVVALYMLLLIRSPCCESNEWCMILCASADGFSVGCLMDAIRWNTGTALPTVHDLMRHLPP
eukprot:scaffold22091_cov16-Tisochrysis_lutea.AAC.2